MPYLTHWSAADWTRPFRSPEHIRGYQDHKLRRLVRHAAARVPFYRCLFEEAGVDVSTFRGREDLHRLPLVCKRDLQAVFLEDRLAAGYNASRCAVRDSSGSTGEPFRLLRTRQEESLLFARRLRAQVLSGLRPWHRRVNIGSPPKQYVYHRIGLFRLDFIPLTASPAEAVEQLIALQPDFLRSPPSGLEAVAPLLRAHGRQVSPSVIFTGAEQLRPRTRIEIERAFQSRIVDFYGATECNVIAWECVHCGFYHVCDDGVILEVLRDGREAGPGESGEAVITALHSYAMPFLRFRIGDVVTRPEEPRPCRIRFGAIERIEGRVADHLWLPDGGAISPYLLIAQMDSVRDVVRYEMEQTALNELLVRFEAKPGAAPPELAAAIRERCAPLLPKVRVEAVAVDSLAYGAERKPRFIKAWTGAR